MEEIKMQIETGTKIICSCGSLVGEFRKYVSDSSNITSDDFSVAGGKIIDNGWACEKCNQPVANQIEGGWRILKFN